MMGSPAASSTHTQQGTPQVRSPTLRRRSPSLFHGEVTGAKNGASAAADAKVTSIVGGMTASADNIDDLHRELISDAEVAQMPPTVRAPSGRKQIQSSLPPVWCYAPFFTDRPAPTLQTEREHRHHVVVEQVIADSKAGALAPLPLALRQRACPVGDDLQPAAAGSPVSAFQARTTTATLRAHPVQVPARIACSARRITLHLPHNRPWRRAPRHISSTPFMVRPAGTNAPLTTPPPAPYRNRTRGKAGQTSRYHLPAPRREPKADTEIDQKKLSNRLGGSEVRV